MDKLISFQSKTKTNIILNRYIVLWIILFRVTLEISYIIIINPSYGYYGFELNLVFYKVLLSWIAFFAFSLSFKKIISTPMNPSNIVVLILFLISYIPSISLYELNGLPDLFFLYLNIYWLLILKLEILFNKKMKVYSFLNSSINLNKFKTIILEGITLFFGIYVFVQAYSYNGLYLHFNIFEGIYDLRIAVRTYDFGILSGYLLVWSVLVFAFAAIRYLISKRWVLFVIVCYLQLLLFSITGAKYTFFIIPISIIMLLFFTDSRIKLIPLGLAGLNIGAIIVFKLFHSISLISLTSFRMYFLPALIGSKFYDYFTSNTPDFLRQSILGRIGLTSQYDLPIPYLIDSIYWDGTASANTGMFPDAYANFGPLGALIYPILIVIIMNLLNRSSMDLKQNTFVPIIVIICVAMNNVSLFTSLGTNGVLFAMILLVLSSGNQKLKKKK